MTPIQELKEQSAEEDIRGLSIDHYLAKEKEFAKQCFEAGMRNGFDSCHSIEWGDELYAPDFEKFYKQISENK